MASHDGAGITSSGVPIRPLLSLLLLAAACGEETPAGVGVVDLQEAFQRSPLVMVSALQIRGALGPTERDLKQRGRALAERRRVLEHGDLELDPQQRARLAVQIEEEAAALRELQRHYRVDLAAARERQGQEMTARIEAVAKQLAQERDLPLLFRRDGALYTPDGAPAGRVDGELVDLTEPVIRELLAKINPTRIPEPDEP